jgi:hypothetical protein
MVITERHRDANWDCSLSHDPASREHPNAPVWHVPVEERNMWLAPRTRIVTERGGRDVRGTLAT